jgi:predicted nucleic acid-binding protein
VKLYADEERAHEARAWPGTIVISAVSLTEVVAAIWGKVARGELYDAHAAVVDRAFIADVRAGRFVVLPVTEEVVIRSLVCVRRHPLRAADALQLASALLARDADAALSTMAVFDRRLRTAAGAEGLALLPAA